MKVTKAVIPAAGLGTRFLPATKAQPKEMLPVVDKPTIQYVVEEAVAAGLTDILIVTGRGKRSIEDHFDYSVELEQNLMAKGDEETLEQIRSIGEMANIHYIRQREALGLGHAVQVAEQHVGDQPFVVMLGDNIFADPVLTPMIEAHAEYGRSIVAFMDVERELISNYGCPAYEQVTDSIVKVTDIVEKPTPEEAPSTLGVIGRYLLTPEIFPALRETAPGYGGEIQLTDAIRRVAKEQAVYGYVFGGRFYDIGRKFDFVRATLELALERPELADEVRALLRTFANDDRVV